MWQNLGFWGALSSKILILSALGVYVIFAVLITRQVELMARTFSTKYQGVMKLLAFLHLGLVLVLILSAVVWL